MSVNVSSPTNSSLSSDQGVCEFSRLNLFIGASVDITRVLLLLPLSVLILCLGARRWREKRSFATESHSDIFTYHIATLELIWVLGISFYYCDVFKGKKSEMITVASSMFNMTWLGEDIFHVLTCVERYLAVVHPITYRLEKNGHGVKIRNISIGVTWVLCVVSSILINVYASSFAIIFLCPLLTSVVVVSFFSLSVLYVLNRPGPGEGGRNKAQTDLAMRRAFFTILAVTGVLWLFFLGLIVSYIFYNSQLFSLDVRCAAVAGTMWSNLPSSLVLPLLYLHRAGKLKFCFRNTQPR